jgi:hypothetical protein
VNKDARSKANYSRSSTKARAAKSAAEAKSARRTWFVLAALTGGLATTGGLLTALAPPPLTPDTAASLRATNQEQPIDQILETAVTIKPGRWHWIYVHQSLTPSGNARTLAQGADGLADHFVIGNGNQLTDGAIQAGPRWGWQQGAGEVPGVTVRSDCVSICLVGNFNQHAPTIAQEKQLLVLIASLQQQLGIASDHVKLGMDGADTSAAGVGTQFPVATFLSQLPQ